MDQYRKSPRANFLDYDGGPYFVTVCTKEQRHYFGEIENDEMILSEIGRYLESELSLASTYSPNIDIPLFTVMPNHFHAIICIKGEYVPTQQNGDVIQLRSPNPSQKVCADSKRQVPLLSRYIASLKGAVTKFAKSLGVEFAWQGRYYDRYIRNNEEGNKIAEYIMNNVARWSAEKFN
ncbi:MAG: transposase [Duncaniella sp.]|nr:transposase [Duncaniella sp.]